MFVVAVLAAGLLLIVLSIALRGEARFSKGDLGELRVWIIRESANQGLGLSTTRIVAGRESEGEACLRTTARFLMIRTAQEVKDVVFYFASATRSREKLGWAEETARHQIHNWTAPL
jgi:hypothetical protein